MHSVTRYVKLDLITQRELLQNTYPQVYPFSEGASAEINTQLKTDMTAISLSGLFLYLGSALQLIHGWVIRWFAGGTFGGTNEFGKSFGNISHCVYQNHLRR